MHCIRELPTPAPAVISWPPCAYNLGREGSLGSQLYSPHVHYTKSLTQRSREGWMQSGPFSQALGECLCWEEVPFLIHTKALCRQTGSSPGPISLYGPRVSGADCPGQCRRTPQGSVRFRLSTGVSPGKKKWEETCTAQ